MKAVKAQHEAVLVALAWIIISCCTQVQAQTQSTTASDVPQANAILTATTSTSTARSLIPIATTTVPCIGDPYKNFSKYDKWFIDNLLGPFQQLQYCQMPALMIVYENDLPGGKIVRYRAYERWNFSAEVTEVSRGCWLFPQILKYVYLGDLYQAFYGTPVLESASTTRPVLFNHLVFFCIPINILTTVCSISLIRKVLKENRTTHIFYYHVTVAIADLVMYVVNAVDGVNLFGMVLWPLCFGLHASAVYPTGMQGFGNSASLALIQALCCTTCTIQALLALDRYLALYRPVYYQKTFASKSRAVKSVCVLVSLNGIIGIVEFFTSNVSMVRTLSSGMPGALTTALNAVEQTRIAVRAVMLNVGLIVQVYTCTMVFVKVRALHRERLTGKSASARKNLVAPCYLLFGTCVLSFIGTCFLTAYLILSSSPLVGTQNWNKAVVAAWLNASYAVKITTPICGGLGFFVHCISCAPFRRLLMKTKAMLWLNDILFSNCSACGTKRIYQQELEMTSKGVVSLDTFTYPKSTSTSHVITPAVG